MSSPYQAFQRFFYSFLDLRLKNLSVAGKCADKLLTYVLSALANDAIIKVDTEG